MRDEKIRGGGVYLATDGELLKFGMTTCIWSRILGLQQERKRDIVLLGVLRCPLPRGVPSHAWPTCATRMERKWQRQCNQFRRTKKGEWFTLTEDILAMVETSTDAWELFAPFYVLRMTLNSALHTQVRRYARRRHISMSEAYVALVSRGLAATE